jgi:hypothetical protein
MNFFDKLTIGWVQMRDSRWEWWYHLTEARRENYWEFWHHLNFDLVAYVEEKYYT